MEHLMDLLDFYQFLSQFTILVILLQLFFHMFHKRYPQAINDDKQKINPLQTYNPQKLKKLLQMILSLKPYLFSIGFLMININKSIMQIEDVFGQKKAGRKIRVKVKTNRNIDFITSIKQDGTISDLANRALSVYLQLAEEAVVQTVKKQLTVSAVKQGIFYMPKSEYVANLLNHDDEVEVIIVKAKPKYPNQIFNTQEATGRTTPIAKINPRLHHQSQKQTHQQSLPNNTLPNNKPTQLELQNQMSISKISKKQKMKNKKKIKQEKKHKEEQTIQKSQIKPSNQIGLKQANESKQIIQQLPRKRLKFQKQDVPVNFTQKPIIIPSPKITFHLQPKIQSPKVFLLQSSKKKFPQNQSRKQSEDIDKKNQLDKIISPLFTHKSPLIGQKTPNQTNPADNLKQKQKEELSNFILSGRKMSEDRKIQKKQRQDPIKSQQQPQQSPPRKSSIIPDKKEPSITNEKQVQQLKTLKQTKNFIVVQQVDSESEQNKKTYETLFVHHRQKELTQIHQKINNFRFDSQEDQQ